ncbi:hypothetical protein BLA50215_01536 [Burkholderia lata]|uniref:hypothetical protein n=1 Tax=Burkholderia lata (strain ATCC 17760 / DSM 23089 / LMG 22485 / NCIMB 9086 / R18194 / 383) TaxID=482957 RepID=UPI00145372DB|nr:hypothetical protein [Burkholderia lata]VWC85585.1 hypothetical protein BLA50215_01536 [Burkholderia lata]
MRDLKFVEIENRFETNLTFKSIQKILNNIAAKAMPTTLFTAITLVAAAGVGDARCPAATGADYSG